MQERVWDGVVLFKDPPHSFHGFFIRLFGHRGSPLPKAFSDVLWRGFDFVFPGPTYPAIHQIRGAGKNEGMNVESEITQSISISHIEISISIQIMR